MAEKVSYEVFKARFLRRLMLGMIGVAILMLAFGAAYTHFSGVSMSMHGWIAMAIGTFISFGIAGVLTAVMVLGRRSGGDEAAGEIDWE